MYYKTFDNTKVEFKSVDDIYNISNPDTVKILYLYNNNITYLDKNIFKHLTTFTSITFRMLINYLHLDKDSFKHLTQFTMIYI
jgi:hypothetical protein